MTESEGRRALRDAFPDAHDAFVVWNPPVEMRPGYFLACYQADRNDNVFYVAGPNVGGVVEALIAKVNGTKEDSE